MNEWWRKYHNATLPDKESDQIRFWSTVAEMAQQQAKQSQDDCFYDAAGAALRDAARAWGKVADAAQAYADYARKRRQTISSQGMGSLLTS